MDEWQGPDPFEAEFRKITSIDTEAWKQEFTLHEELFEKLAYHLPAELRQTKEELSKRLAA